MQVYACIMECTSFLITAIMLSKWNSSWDENKILFSYYKNRPSSPSVAVKNLVIPYHNHSGESIKTGCLIIICHRLSKPYR